MAYHQINDNGIEPLLIVRSLISVAGKIGGATHSPYVRKNHLSYIIFVNYLGRTALPIIPQKRTLELSI